MLELGIPTPQTVILDDAAAKRTTCFRAVCKPRHGAGSQATFLVRDTSDLMRAWTQARAELPGADFILQPYVPGAAVSVSFLVGPGQSLALTPTAQHLSEDGRFHYLGCRLPLEPNLAGRAVAFGRRVLAAFTGLAGYVGVDIVLGEARDGSQDWVIEVNPRLTTSYLGLRRLAQDNLAEAWLRLARGETVAPIRWKQEDIRISLTDS
jgi:predicted ATP-grasp superfamily ATP-dependent carboligase